MLQAGDLYPAQLHALVLHASTHRQSFGQGASRARCWGCTNHRGHGQENTSMWQLSKLPDTAWLSLCMSSILCLVEQQRTRLGVSPDSVSIRYFQCCRGRSHLHRAAGHSTPEYALVHPASGPYPRPATCCPPSPTLTITTNGMHACTGPAADPAVATEMAQHRMWFHCGRPRAPATSSKLHTCVNVHVSWQLNWLLASVCDWH